MEEIKELEKLDLETDRETEEKTERRGENRRRLSREEILRIREKRARRDFSMIIFPTGDSGRKLVDKVGLLHKIYKHLQRALLNREITIEEITSYEKRVNDIAEEAWKALGTFFPAVANIDLSQWRSLTESYEEKKTVVPRFSALIAVPYSDLHGRLLTVVKHIEMYKRKLLKHFTFNPSLCEKVAEIGEKFEKEVDEILKEYLPKTGIEANL